MLTRYQGALLHTWLKRNGKPSVTGILALHLSSPEVRWCGWHISITSTFLLLIKPSHLTLTVFHLWLILQFPPFSPPWSQLFSPAISLKCLGKKIFSSLMLICSCYKFHLWLPTDSQVAISPWNDSFSCSKLISFLPLWSYFGPNNFLSLSIQKYKLLLQPLCVYPLSLTQIFKYWKLLANNLKKLCKEHSLVYFHWIPIITTSIYLAIVFFKCLLIIKIAKKMLRLLPIEKQQM